MVHSTVHGKPHSPDEDSPMIPATPWPSVGILVQRSWRRRGCPRRLLANFSLEVILLPSEDSGVLRDIDLPQWIAGGTLEE